MRIRGENIGQISLKNNVQLIVPEKYEKLIRAVEKYITRAKALAEEEGRSLSNYIEWLINNDIKRREQEEQE